MFIYLKKKGQSTLEYTIVIAVIVAALIAMNTYIKRSVQGRMRQSADDMGEQFSPQYTTGTITTSLNAGSTETITGGVKPVTTVVTSQNQARNITNEKVASMNQEWWP